jgi:hypothetical protein
MDRVDYGGKVAAGVAALALCIPLLVAASPQAGSEGGCFGRLSNQPSCNAPHAVSIPPFRGPQQPRTVGTASPRRLPAVAQIDVQSFRKVSSDVGEWSGIVRGSGEIHLVLQILEQGQVVSIRPIGSITLANQPSSFHFRSSLPTSPNWSWRIVSDYR